MNKPSRFQMLVQIVGVLVYIGSWVLLWGDANRLQGPPYSWAPPTTIIVGTALGLTVLLSFYSWYIASDDLDRGMRTAITTSLFVFFVELASYLLFVPGLLGERGTDPNAPEPFAQSVFTSLTGFMGVILAFYFAATAVEKASENVAAAISDKARIQSASTAAAAQAVDAT